MATPIATAGVHHLRLTVTDVDRARAFYTNFLGFQVAAEIPTGVVLTNGAVLLGLGPGPESPAPGDRFNESRVGLDHLCFSVGRRSELEDAVRLFDEHGVLHGEIMDLTATFGIYVLVFRDPDNIQLELTAPANDGA